MKTLSECERIYAVRNAVFGGKVPAMERLVEPPTEFIRADLSMQWVPISEANLQHGERVSIFDGSNIGHDAIYNDLGPQSMFVIINIVQQQVAADAITHVLRIKPPRTNEPCQQ